MSKRYEKRFAGLRAHNQKAFIPFTMLGWPDKETCLLTIRTMIESGATALELGIAFSDPVADGPLIQQAACETIASGFGTSDAFALVKQVREVDDDIPIGLLVYYNMVLAHGVDTFFARARDSGVDGILIVDLPPEEADEIAASATKYDIASIFIVSTLTSQERLNLILKRARGFLYAVSRLGITGVEERYDTQLARLIKQVELSTDLPVCVGFGISTPEQAESMFALGASGVITGSKIISLIGGSDRKSLPLTISTYVRSMLKKAESAVNKC